MNGEKCTHCGAAPVEPGTGLCEPCFEAMPLGVWVSAWDVERGPSVTSETTSAGV